MISKKDFNGSKNYFLFIILVLALILLQSSFVSAMNIAYTTTNIDFQPNAVVEVDYFAINTLNEAIGASVLFTGDLSQYMRAEPATFNLEPYGSRAFKVIITFPETIEKPGSHRQTVMVKEEKLEKHAGINVFAAPGVPLFIHVAYEGKYLDTLLEATNAKLNEPVYFTVTVTNLGSETINTISGIIKVYDIKDTLIKSLNTNMIMNLEKGASSSLTAEMQTIEMTAGRYYAKAKVNYDEFSKETEDVAFRIGELKLSILNYSQEADSGKINKFFVEVESGWNDAVENVSANIIVKKDAEQLVSFRTLVDTVGGWEKKQLEGYLDASNIKPGTYDVEITLNYAGETDFKKGTIEIKEVKEGIAKGISTLTIVLIVIAVLILINILIWLFVLKRRKKKE